MYETTFHRDGTVTVWDAHAQQWTRTAFPSSELLATLMPLEREKVMRHIEAQFNDDDDADA
jgi:hypothetical protein